MKSSKFKVGDKVRVISNEASANDDRICAHKYPIGYEGTIEEVNNVYAYLGRWSVHPDDLELITPLTFDHSLALQGSPVYMNGEIVDVSWLPGRGFWDVFHPTISYNFDKEGKCVSWNDKTIFLTTIPPLEYVEESRWVWVREDGAYKTEAEARSVARLKEPYQLCEVKIKVKKPQ